MTRQYIGARYVPQFYENPDTQDATWKSGVVYEPLTMVTYNNATYTSKKTVPATIGDPATNPSYWVATGNYNGQIAYLQQQIGNLPDLKTEDKTDLVSAINELNDGLYITPDDFSGADDAAKIQAAIDYAIANYYPTIVLNRRYDITGSSLKINKPNALSDSNYYRYRAYLTFIGLNEGKIYKGDSGYIFTADFRSGYISFINITFEGGVHQDSTMSDAQIFAARKAGCSVFDTSKLLNFKTFNCTYVLLGVVFDGHECIDAANNAQSIVSTNDVCTYCHAFWTLLYSWACTVNNALIEVCSHGIMDYEDDNTTNVGVTAFKIRNSLIENIENGPAILFETARHAYIGLNAVSINESYFENCVTALLDIAASVIESLNIEDNYFTLGNSPFDSYNCINIKNNYDSINISHNFFRTGALGIYCSNTNYENAFIGNTFEQVGGLGSLTNSTKAQLTESLKTYLGSFTTSTINGNTSVNNIALSDFGTITNKKGLVIVGIVPGSTYNTRADITGVGAYFDSFNIHTYGTDAQTYEVKYLVFGF